MKNHSSYKNIVTATTQETTCINLKVADYKTLEIQITNKGIDNLSSFKIYSKVHDEGKWFELDTGGFTATNELIFDVNNNPSILPANEDSYIILNCEGKYKYLITATSVNNSVLQLYSYLED